MAKDKTGKSRYSGCIIQSSAAQANSMSTAFLVLMSMAMIAVVGVLMVGVFSMARGGEFNKKYGNKLMQARIALQAVALILFVLAILSAKK
jgi:hypothetical protein